MSYKVLYIDDDLEYLLGALDCWNKMGQQEDVRSNTTHPLEFSGLSFRDNSNNSRAVSGEIYYVDVDDIEKWNPADPKKSELQVKLLRRFLEKITEIQPDAILSDIHFGSLERNQKILSVYACRYGY